MTYPDPELDWVAILEAQGAGPEKYHVHATNHQMACQKYVVAAKQAKTSGNKERAALLRKIGNKHKAAAEALLAIANHHTDALYGIQLKKKAQLMPKKQPVNEDQNLENIIQEQEIEEIDEDTRVRDLIHLVLEEKALDFTKLVHEIVAERISDQLDGLQEALQEALAADSDGSDEDSEEDDKESPEIQGEEYRYAETEPGPAGGTHVVAPMGQEKEPDPTASAKKFPTGRQDGDKNKKLTQGTRKSGTKSSPGMLGDEDRLQNSRN